MIAQHYVSENLSINIVNSIIENKQDKTYLLERYRKLTNHIEWFIKHMDLLELKNRQFLYTYQEEIQLLRKAISF